MGFIHSAKFKSEKFMETEIICLIKLFQSNMAKVDAQRNAVIKVR